MLLISIYFINTGINNYKSAINRSNEFKGVETAMFKNMMNYAQYTYRGVNLFFIPGPTSIFSKNSGLFSELTAKIDSMAGLKISNDMKSRLIFQGMNSTNWDFSGIILLFVPLGALLYGFESLRYKEYLKFLSSFLRYKKVFLFVLFSRVIILAISSIIIYSIILLFILTKNIAWSTHDYLGLGWYFLLVFLLLLFFFAMGFLIGSTRSKINSTATILILWFVFVFLFPGTIHTFIAGKANTLTSSYKLELEKIQYINEYQKKSLEIHKNSNLKGIDRSRAIIENYWKKEYSHIEATDTNLKNEMLEIIQKNRNISIFCPVSFFQLTSNEISSQGYSNFLDFYSFSQERKREFVRFYFDQNFYSKNHDMINFIKGDEAFFFAESSLPDNFFAGLWLTMLYALALFSFSFFIYKKSLFGLKESDINQIETLEKSFKRGELSVWCIAGNNFSNLLYNLFSGEEGILKKTGRPIKIEFDGMELNKRNSNKKFIYLCRPDEIPGDIKVKNLYRFMGKIMKSPRKEYRKISLSPVIKSFLNYKFQQLSKREKGEILLLLTLLMNRQVFLVNDMATDLPVDFAIGFKERLEQLASQGALVLYLTTNDCFIPQKEEKKTFFYESHYWSELVDYHKNRNLLSQKIGKKTNSTNQ